MSSPLTPPSPLRICASTEVSDGGRGFRFELDWHGEKAPAFVIRHRGQAHGYLNRCGHVPIELDWEPGEFFDVARIYLLCATHGALYDPASGRCLGGRCEGRGLTPVAIEERDGTIYLLSDRGISNGE
jgi:nitrite reductase/ring-hydroxylating ferredoxin subunit